MSSEPIIRRAPIRVLRDSVARKIAAGEVIDRPASAVRELLDNSLDAGSTEISLHITGGGIESIRVVDNGWGMSEEDLRLCWLPHATSKIESEEDLLRIHTLGFRGEALSSLANVSRLEILSKPIEEEIGHRLIVHGGQLISLTPQAAKPGTVVTVSDLFFAIPARRKFLKRPSTETNLCRSMFLEKALPFPDREFKLFIEGKLTHFLPISHLTERIAQVYPEETRQSSLHELSGSGTGFRFRIVTGSPEAYRKDRKHLQLYVNRRRIWDFSLLQGVEYAFSSYLPGGTFPICYLFLEIDPEWVDFNIHPAKKEARIRNTEDLRSRILEVLSSYLLSQGRASLRNLQLSGYSPVGDQASLWVGEGSETRPPTIPRGLPHSFGGKQGLAFNESADSILKQAASDQPPILPDAPFLYKGQVFGLFLLVEWNDTVFLVDQHAAHERFIYDELSRDNAPQPLLIPLEVSVDPEEEARLLENASKVRPLGVQLEKLRSGNWALTALPSAFRGAEEEVITLVKTQTGTLERIKQELFAQIACKKAIKDGEGISPLPAYEILRYVFSLDNPRCPHGRPLWVQISREELLRGVGRIL
ncbi:MAG: DNA mismatch repair endonuclease MutL [Spirochaetes bacterium]|nr:DNA mismatch repair endonuclease MutL [Spirochaetota bacterium]